MSQNEARMTRPFIAEVRLFGFEPVPDGWRACDGCELPIGPHQALFSVLGWRFGGDGWATFALPRLRLVDGPEVVFAIAVNGVLAVREEA